MPFITLRTSKILSDSLRSYLAEGLSLVTEKILRKEKRIIVILFEVARQPAQWYVGGTVRDDNDEIFELNIAVTEGTNTDVEKAEWIAAVWKLATEACGNMPHPNYISIHEVAGRNWGYNGLSQEQRKIQSQ
jgi:4-oxalocrotonate tautomerase